MAIIGVDKAAKEHLLSTTGKKFIALATEHGAGIVGVAGIMAVLGEIPGVKEAIDVGSDAVPGNLKRKVGGYTTVQGYLDDLESSGLFKAGGVGGGELMTVVVGAQFVQGSLCYQLKNRDTAKVVGVVGGGIGAGFEMGYQGFLTAWVKNPSALPSKISMALTSVEVGGGVMGAVFMSNDRDHELLGFAMGIDAGFGASWIVGSAKVSVIG